MSGKRKKKKLQQRREQQARREEWQQRAESIARGEAVLADPSRQNPSHNLGAPDLYRDREFTCRDCGRVEVWTARQQKWWYEQVKGPVYSTAVRCHECRRRRRTGKARVHEEGETS